MSSRTGRSQRRSRLRQKRAVMDPFAGTALRGLGGPAGSPRSNPIPSTSPDNGSWAGYSLYAISLEVSEKPIADAPPEPALHCTHRCRSPSESPPQSSPCEPVPIGNAPLHDPPSTSAAFWLATSLCCVREAYDRWWEEKRGGRRFGGLVHVCTPGSSVQRVG